MTTSAADALGELQALRNHVAHWCRSGIDDAALLRADEALMTATSAKHVGDMQFEGWLSEHERTPHHIGYSKQDMRDCYRAGYLEARADPSEAAIVWPKSKSVKRRDDMSPSDTLQVGIDESGDLQVSLWTDRRGYSSVEFCASGGNGGGRSPNTRRALIALMVAIEADGDQS